MIRCENVFLFRGDVLIDHGLHAAVGGNCYVRAEPNTSGAKLGVAHAGDKLIYRGEVSDDGWYAVEYDGAAGWVSGKYAKIA